MRKAALLLAAALLFILTGCWDMKEINDRSYVVGLGIDSADDGSYVFTFQKAVPVGINSAADSNSIRYENVSVSASSPDRAVRAIRLSSSSELNFEHLSCIILGSGLVHSGFTDMIEYLMQQPDVRRQCIVAAAADTAQVLLSSDISDNASSVSIASMLRQTDISSGSSAVLTLSTLSCAILSGSGYELYVVGKGEQAQISASDADNSLAVTGAYVFSSAGQVTAADAQKADMLRLFSPRQRGCIVEADDGAGHTVTFSVDRSRCRTRCDIIDGRLFCRIILRGSCTVSDSGGASAAEINEDMLNDAVYRSMSELIFLSRQELGPSAVGLDDAFRREDHRWYIENRDNFNSLYMDAVIELDVKCHLERSGVLR